MCSVLSCGGALLTLQGGSIRSIRCEACVRRLQVRSSKQDQIHNSIVSTLLALMDGLTSRGQVGLAAMLCRSWQW